MAGPRAASSSAETATRWGIEPSYFDVRGRLWQADDETLGRIVAALSAGGAPPAEPERDPPAPEPAFQGDGRKAWLLAVQLYSVRSRGNWGHGDFGDLAALLELVADLGGAGVGLNPLHALNEAGTGSPYAPNSRLFLNPLYLDVAAIEDTPRSFVEKHAAAIEWLRAAELVDTAAVAKLKLAALRAAYRAFAEHGSATRRGDFEAYRAERGTALERFAAFETLRALFPGPWQQWPAQWRQPSDAVWQELRQRHADALGFHQYLQWIAERQIERCRDIARRRGLSIGLYLDTAVGVDPAGADAWIDQDAMLRDLSVGAPPDQFNPAGQDWGLTAYNPHGLAAREFEPFRQMLRLSMRHAGAVRLDHVLGLMRLFVIPRGHEATRGAYLRLPLQTMLSIVAEESRRWHCIAIGEDLGTVPEGLRTTLSAWGVWSTLVTLFERDGDGSFRAPARYAERAIATFNTHDLATFEGWLSGHDLRLKRALGLDPGETDAERAAARAKLAWAIGEVTHRGEVDFAAVAAFLAATPTKLVSIAIEDVLGLTEQVNVPGTVSEHPNWRRRWPVALDALHADPRLHRIAATFTRAGRGGGTG